MTCTNCRGQCPCPEACEIPEPSRRTRWLNAATFILCAAFSALAAAAVVFNLPG